MKIRIILPYFGQFNNYFEYWIESCGQNSKIDFLIMTDQEIPKNHPKNITFVYTTLNELKKKFENKLKLKINLERPYKLCDYKAYYGFLFSEYLEGFDFWGYCDCDLIFGDIQKFLTKEILEKYDKILRTGHLSVIRNKKEINENFLKYDTYKMVVTSPAIYGYDEAVNGYHLGFAGELLENGYRFLDEKSWIADIDFRYYPFYDVSQERIPCVFDYDKGHVYKITRNNGRINQEEMMYVHLQKRKMDVNKQTSNKKYIIFPNRVDCFDEKLLDDESFWEKISEEKESYFDSKQEIRANRKRDMIRFLHEPKKLESFMYRVKKR